MLQTAKDEFFFALGPFKKVKNLSSDYFIYSPDFFLKTSQFLKPQKSLFINRLELLKILSQFESKAPRGFKKGKGFELKEFSRVFLKTQNEIKTKKFDKLVPVFFQKFPLKLQFRNKLFFLKKLLKLRQPYVYALWNSHEGIMGCSPEVLFSKKSLNLASMALAGTYKKGKVGLLKDLKERAEHRFVVRSILSVLKSYALWVKSSKTKILSFWKLQHLCTKIKWRLKRDISFLSCVQAFHPTPALGGFPAKKAFTYFLKSKKARYKFGAPFGIASQNKSFVIVAIRNLIWKKEKAFIGAGCGIVKQSQLKKEFNEILLKQNFISKVLGL